MSELLTHLIDFGFLYAEAQLNAVLSELLAPLAELQAYADLAGFFLAHL